MNIMVSYGQDWLHHLQNPVQNENVKPLVQKLTQKHHESVLKYELFEAFYFLLWSLS